MYDPHQREKANQLQRELSEGKAAKEALRAMQDQVKEVCRCQDYSPKSKLPHDILRDLILEIRRLQGALGVVKDAYKKAEKASIDGRSEDKEKIERLTRHLAAQDDLIVAYYIDNKELITNALKAIGQLKEDDR